MASNFVSQAAQSNPLYHHRTVWVQRADPEIRIHYVEALPSSGSPQKGTILLIHGFPETCYQYRHVIQPLADAGYHVVAPDYRGAGHSSKPHVGPEGFTKDILAQDLHTMMEEHVKPQHKQVHLVGHDIGGMIAHAYVTQFPDDVASIIWGECPLPGTKYYENNKHSPALWHFAFQGISDIAEALVAGKERIYLKHFFDRLSQNPDCFSEQDLDFYTTQYSQPGSLRCHFQEYKMFETDKLYNLAWKEKNGKVKNRAMILSGDASFIRENALEMAEEMYANVEYGLVANSGHYIAEENPEDFVKKVLSFVVDNKLTRGMNSCLLRT